MTSRSFSPDDDETAKALEALTRDPQALRSALRILREELEMTLGPERQTLAATISLLERRTTP